MGVPAGYQGREQSYLKHRVLEEYLLAWGMKLGSLARQRAIRLCYVDAFAGPWKSKDERLADTSIAIGLEALEAAAERWANAKYSIVIEAMFVESNPNAFAELQTYLAARKGNRVRARPWQGEFGASVNELKKFMGDDAALVFVDPTGWKGAAMQFIAPLLGTARRDVLINVMFDHINRFKDDPRAFLRQQMRDFFGLADHDLPEGLDEEGLLAFYRDRLKQIGGVVYAADLAIPHPTIERTKFRLVVGGHHPAVIELFRNTERKVVGEEAAAVRDDASRRADEAKTGQLSFTSMHASTDARYESLHAEGLRCAGADVLDLLAGGEKSFKELWPRVLEKRHITKTELAHLVWTMRERAMLTIANAKPGERTSKDNHRLLLQGQPHGRSTPG